MSCPDAMHVRYPYGSQGTPWMRGGGEQLWSALLTAVDLEFSERMTPNRTRAGGRLWSGFDGCPLLFVGSLTRGSQEQGAATAGRH
jgi:hypothetical protein